MLLGIYPTRVIQNGHPNGYDEHMTTIHNCCILAIKDEPIIQLQQWRISVGFVMLRSPHHLEALLPAQWYRILSEKDRLQIVNFDLHDIRSAARCPAFYTSLSVRTYSNEWHGDPTYLSLQKVQESLDFGLLKSLIAIWEFTCLTTPSVNVEVAKLNTYCFKIPHGNG
ncbi:unnamed protein product [Owenia fusiformis]|uniref:Uncharacterized protein n=1 Tax=Owenia fusiformis TaxID=6347 RepID=A0A8J1XSD8_OWEFU|nr:unnamed protein product [Owenia fusiformis]